MHPGQHIVNTYKDTILRYSSTQPIWLSQPAPLRAPTPFLNGLTRSPARAKEAQRRRSPTLSQSAKDIRRVDLSIYLSIYTYISIYVEYSRELLLGSQSHFWISSLCVCARVPFVL